MKPIDGDPGCRFLVGESLQLGVVPAEYAQEGGLLYGRAEAIVSGWYRQILAIYRPVAA